MTIDPRRLLHLLAVAQAGTFGKAARDLRISQPALSNSIATLERSLGVKLLDRSRRGASLTDHGRLVSERAGALDALLSTTLNDLQRAKLGLDGTLRVGVSPVGCVAVVPEAVAMLAEDLPGAAITITELHDDVLIDQLTRGAIDIAISPTGLNRDPAGMECEPLFVDRLVVAVSRANPLAGRSVTSLKQISGSRFIMPARDTEIYRHINGLFTNSGTTWPSRVITSNSLLLIKTMVRKDDAITIISDRMIAPEISAGWIAAVGLREKIAKRQICIRRMRRAPPSTLVDRFVMCLRSCSRAFN